MDVAYDHIQKEALSPEQQAAKAGSSSNASNSGSTEQAQQQQPKPTLNTEFQEAYNSLLSTTPWGAKLGGFFSDVKKQSTTFYDEARQEAGVVGGEAFKGFSDLRQSLVSRARSLSTGAQDNAAAATAATSAAEEDEKEGEASNIEKAKTEDNESMVARFKSEAAKRLKELEKAEEAADAAIFRFGANIGTFLKEAVTIAPPSDDNKDGSSKVLFESKGEDGKRVIHGTRFEAQLHAIHTSTDKFTADPESDAFREWKEGFDIKEKEEAIKGDLERYEELRRMKERLVPEKVAEADFWARYYFLRMVVEAEEIRRKEMLKGAAGPTTEPNPSWDSDSDSDTDSPNASSTPQGTQNSSSTPKQKPNTAPGSASPASLATIQPPSSSSNDNLKPAEPRRSQDEKSQPDSDASYDLVSGATSRAPGSPKEGRKGEAAEEEEEDWE